MWHFLVHVSLLALTFPMVVHPQESFRVMLVAISVKDLDSTATWYHKYLGFNLMDKKDFPDNNVTVAILENNSVRIELVQHKESVAPSKLIPKLANPALIQGYGKVAYDVADIEQIVRTMKSDSVTFVHNLRDVDRGTFVGYKSCIVLDNNGNWVQLYQKK